MNKNALGVTRTAVLAALVVVTQAVTAPLGTTLVTGPLVNLILIVSTMFAGLPTGLTVAVISPICAKLVGIGPFWTLIPFVAAGNAALAAVWGFLGRKSAFPIVAAAVAAAAKFLVLYAGVARIAVPLILKLPEPQASAVANTFSLPQLFTAAAGGALALAVFPMLRKAIGGRAVQGE